MPNGQAPVTNNFAPASSIPNTPGTPGYNPTGGAPFQTPAPASNPSTISAPAPITPASISSTETPSSFQAPQNIPVLSAPQVPTLQPTQGEQVAQGMGTSLESLNQQLAGKSQYEINAAKQLGYGVTTDASGNITVNDPELTSLNSQIAALQEQAKAIPLQVMQGAEGRGVTQGGVDSQQTAMLRQNAIQATMLSSLVAAKQGQLSMAQMMVNQAVTQKYAPIEDQVKAMANNLAIIQSSPNYTLQQQNRAQQQQMLLNQQAAQLDLEKQNYLNAQNEALKYAPVASAQQLQAMQQANSPAQVAAIAAALGIQQPLAGRYTTHVTTMTGTDGSQHMVMVTTDSLTGQTVGAAKPYSGSATPGTQIGSSPTPPIGSETAPQTTAPSTQNAGGASTGQGPAPVASPHSPSGFSTQVGSGTHQLPLAQYGLLANTDLNPNTEIDQSALAYINEYLKNGSAPSASTLGQGVQVAYFGQVQQRANALYQQATGNSLTGVNPEIVSQYQKLVGSNMTLSNKLNVQEKTIAANFGLNLENLNANNINKSIPVINGLVDYLRTAAGDPNTAQYASQVGTIQNELSNLVAVKNAGGTTVADKIMSGELLAGDLSVDQATQVMNTLLKEAQNSQNAIGSAAKPLYQQIDPLMQDPNNPARKDMLNSQFVEKNLQAQNLHYDNLMAEMSPKAPPGTQPAMDAKTGKIGFASLEAIGTGAYIPL